MATIFQNLVSGTVSDNPLAIGALTLNSAGLSSLAAVVGPDTMWATLDPLAVNGAPEVVQITAHTAAATSATIVRAQQGSAARQHPQNTKWVGGIVTKADLDLLPHRLLTAKGGLISASAANVPSVLAVGANQQALRADSSQTPGLKWDWLGTVPSFTNATARDAAIASPAEDMLATTTADDRLWVHDGTRWISLLPYSANGVDLKVSRSTSLVLTTATNADVSFDTEVFDLDGWGVAPTANWTVPAGRGGLYALSYKSKVDNITGSATSVGFKLNTVALGTNAFKEFQVAGSSPFANPYNDTTSFWGISTILWLAAGDVIALNISNPSVSTRTYTSISMQVQHLAYIPTL